MVLDMALLRDKKRSFEVFRESYERRDVIDENKQLLRDRYMKAKAMGERVNMARKRIEGIKGNIEQLRVERAMKDVQDGGVGGDGGARAALSATPASDCGSAASCSSSSLLELLPSLPDSSNAWS